MVEKQTDAAQVEPIVIASTQCSQCKGTGWVPLTVPKKRGAVSFRWKMCSCHPQNRIPASQ